MSSYLRQKPVIVLAGNHRQFLDYLQVHPVETCIEADDMRKLLGIEASRYVITGDFFERADAADMMALAKSRVRE